MKETEGGKRPLKKVVRLALQVFREHLILMGAGVRCRLQKTVNSRDYFKKACWRGSRRSQKTHCNYGLFASPVLVIKSVQKNERGQTGFPGGLQ